MTAAPITCHHTEVLLKIDEQVAREDVDQGGDEQDPEEEQEDRVEAARVPAGEEEAEGQVQEGGAAVGDRGGDGEQPEQVEPARVVPGFHAAQFGSPPVDAARGRVGGHQLGQAEADAQDEAGQDGPAPGDGGRSTAVPPAVEGGEATGQDGDDGEADGEVGEARPGAAQLLLVAELGQLPLVGRERRRCVMTFGGEMSALFVDTFGHAGPPFVGDPGTEANGCCGHDSKPRRRVTGMLVRGPGPRDGEGKLVELLGARAARPRPSPPDLTG